jgi:hypothetical protein
MGTWKNKKVNIAVQKLLLRRRILEIPFSNLGSDTSYPGRVPCFFNLSRQVLQLHIKTDHIGFLINTCLLITYQ